MRKIFLHIAMSIDGFIESSDKKMDWQFVDDDFEEYVNTVLRSIDTMIFGRVSFELLAQYWPTAVENPAAAVDPSNPARHIEAAHMMDGLQKIAVSKTMKKTGWNNSRIVSDTAELEKLKAEPGRDIALFAGGNLTSSLMRLGLIDEYRLLIYPGAARRRDASVPGRVWRFPPEAGRNQDFCVGRGAFDLPPARRCMILKRKGAERDSQTLFPSVGVLLLEASDRAL